MDKVELERGKTYIVWGYTPNDRNALEEMARVSGATIVCAAAGVKVEEVMAKVVDNMLRDRLKPLIRAVTDKGDHPSYHDRVAAEVKARWPRLMSAIAEVLDGLR